MDLTIEELKRKTGIKSVSSLNTALSRTEYSHIKKIRQGRNVVYTNIYPLDIIKLNLFIRRIGLTKFQIRNRMDKYLLLCKLPLDTHKENVTKILHKYCKN